MQKTRGKSLNNLEETFSFSDQRRIRIGNADPNKKNNSVKLTLLN